VLGFGGAQDTMQSLEKAGQAPAGGDWIRENRRREKEGLPLLPSPYAVTPSVPAAATAAAGTNVGTVNMPITVTATPGMDEQTLAKTIGVEAARTWATIAQNRGLQR
jgi:hypothetical protein